MNNKIIKNMAYMALGVALVVVATFVLSFPIPGGAGYVNLGDSVIIIFAFLFGPIVGGMTGGIGSLLADFLAGFPLYSPFSLVIKGIQGVVVGILSNRAKKLYLRQLVVYAIGGLIMIVGYFFADIVLFDIVLASTGLLFNLLQAFLNILVVSLLYRQIFKIWVLMRIDKAGNQNNTVEVDNKHTEQADNDDQEGQ